ncbi:hypothetical protein EST38_g3370 [Candolleomyces aberdarensis]|uniref:Rhodanese domain-containing protein n=1 Tax=Candolleomyces aberdarensis TaxID=2316362 RepID=A0A4Q2DQX9_9AGAR|nr:hypothetical protein EST38_g3370 [Candolleomyces aberdarensis]
MSAFVTTHSQPPAKYLTADELAAIIKSSDKVAEKDYLVVDVRDDDFVGGNIVGCHNQPSGKFMLHVHDLARKTKDVPLVIFHCALSQVRGPKAARIYNETRRNLFPEDNYEVAVLREGFTTFQAKYKDDPVLVEKWEAEYWSTDY